MKIRTICLLVAAYGLLTACGTVENSESTITKEEADTTEFTIDEMKSSNMQNSEAYQTGKELGNKITRELESIDWESNYDKAEDAGKALAEWLNGK